MGSPNGHEWLLANGQQPMPRSHSLSPQTLSIIERTWGEQSGELLISEPLHVGEAVPLAPSTARLVSSVDVNRWRHLNSSLNSQGRSLFAQLYLTLATEVPGIAGPREEDIDRAFELLRDTAENAIDAGFEGVELAVRPQSLAGELLALDGGLVCDFLQVLIDVWGHGNVAVNVAAPHVNGLTRELVKFRRQELAWLHIRPCTAAEAARSIGAWRRQWRDTLLVSGSFDASLAQIVRRTGLIDGVGVSLERGGALLQ